MKMEDIMCELERTTDGRIKDTIHNITVILRNDDELGMARDRNTQFTYSPTSPAFAAAVSYLETVYRIYNPEKTVYAASILRNEIIKF